MRNDSELVFWRRIGQRTTHRHMCALSKYGELLQTGKARVRSMVKSLEKQTCFRIYSETRSLICTIDSTERMVRAMGRGTLEAALAIGGSTLLTSDKLTIDTVIMDYAACVLETSVAVPLALGVQTFTLVGDNHQLQPFSLASDRKWGMTHIRSLMWSALDAGEPKQFLSTQYRMHPHICQGYSNPSEVPKKVVREARSALERYGANADVRVITFHNTQKRDIEREFEKRRDIRHILISSADACRCRCVFIISTVRSGTENELSGPMLNPRRINVALSRASWESIIVGAMWHSVAGQFAS